MLRNNNNLFILFQSALILLWSIIPLVAKSTTARKLVIGVDGGTESIRACCFDAATGKVVGKACAVPYKTYHPSPGWAEQNPQDWYDNLCQAVRDAVDSVTSSDIQGTSCDSETVSSVATTTSASTADQVVAICVDTTCCSVVALDKNHQPLRPALLWMDARSAPQTREIMDKCKGDTALAVNCDGEVSLKVHPSRRYSNCYNFSI
jgi:sugar (pentulose or hexulose) kinase